MGLSHHRDDYLQPTVVNGTVYAGSMDNSLYAIDANTGTLKWKYTTSREIRASPIVSGGVVYFGNDGPNSNNFYAINAADGTLR